MLPQKSMGSHISEDDATIGENTALQLIDAQLANALRSA
jgi:hypothetical protein